MKDTNCPYCNKEIEINHDDGYGYEDGEVFQQECSYCYKNFTYTTSTHFYYSPEKAPCLNGEPHSWKDIIGYPAGFQKNRHHCKNCDEIELKDSSLRYNGKTDSWFKPEALNE